MPDRQTATLEVGGHPGQDRDDRLSPPDEERLDGGQRSRAQGTGSQLAEIDQRLRPQVPDLVHEARSAKPGDEPPRQGSEGMDGRADHHVRRWTSDLGKGNDGGEAGHVHHSSPVVSAVGESPQPDEAHAVERLVPDERGSLEPLFVPGEMAEPGSEDGHVAAPPHDLSAEGVVPGRPQGKVRRLGVVVEDPDPAAAGRDLSRPRLRHRPPR